MGDVDPDLALFASWVREEEARERAERREAKSVRDHERQAQALVQAKDDAASELKRVRQDSRSTPEQKATADTAYRQALAAVVAAETGASPDWAPPPEAEGEGTDAEGEGTEPEADAEGTGPETEGTEPETAADADTPGPPA